MNTVQARARDGVLRIADSSPELSGLLRHAARAIGRAVPMEGWCGFTLDPATLVKTAGVHEAAVAPALLGRLFELEYRHRDANLFADLARERRPAAVLTDRASSARFREVLRPSGYGHELRLVLLDQSRAWGGFVFLREPASPPFTPAETRFVATLGRHLARGVRRILLGAARPPATPPAHLSPHTVRDHVKAIFAKTGVRSRAELVAALRPIP